MAKPVPLQLLPQFEYGEGVGLVGRMMFLFVLREIKAVGPKTFF